MVPNVCIHCGHSEHFHSRVYPSLCLAIIDDDVNAGNTSTCDCERYEEEVAPKTEDKKILCKHCGLPIEQLMSPLGEKKWYHKARKVGDGMYISSNSYCLMMTEEVLPEGTMLDLEAAEPQDVVMPEFNSIGDLWNAINALREEVRKGVK